MRRLAKEIHEGKSTWDQPYEPAESVEKAMRTLYEEARTAQWTARTQTRGTEEIWSDASDIGLGIVFEQMNSAAAWQFEPLQVPIFVAELLAGAAALRHMDKKGTGILYMDNTAAISAITKGYSGSPAGNVILRKIYEARLRHWHKVCYVHTTMQRADDPSRGILNYHKVSGPLEAGERIRWAPP